MNVVRFRLFPNRRALARRRGFAASVIVLALMAVMAALLLSTTRSVAALDRELRLVEQRQLQKYALPSPVPNRPSQRPSPPLPGPGPE
jgi:hypothetical protein